MNLSVGRRPARVTNAGFLLALACAAAIGAVYVQEALVNWNLLDMSAYQSAASRIRTGDVLYGGDVHLNSAYRYAPWFAYAWVPISQVPDVVVRIGWSLLLLAGGAMAVRPLLHWSRPHLVLALVFIPLMLGSASGGNVQPLMIGALVWGLPTRWGWAAVAFAASLKIVPIAFCAVFVAERRWAQAVAAVAATIALWLPVLWMPVEPITFETGLSRMLPAPWWLLPAAIGAAIALALAAKRSRFTPVAAALSALVALPRLFAYELSMLLPAVPADREPQEER